MKSYRAVLSPELSDAQTRRYVIIDTETGQVIDDSQGYGYKTIRKAYEGFSYRFQSQKKRAEQKKIRSSLNRVLLENPELESEIEELCYQKIPSGYLVSEEDIEIILMDLSIDLSDYGISISDLISCL